ncbi:MAG: hypothetical protein K0M45_11210 [Candidatus Paracaedibacteraceae bacterium]|nr:hypothetical protein [Candidatus Paracaedibacteraceae bacterium]
MKKLFNLLSLTFVLTTFLLATEHDQPEDRKRPFNSLNVVEKEKSKKRRLDSAEEAKPHTLNLLKAIKALNEGDITKRELIIDKIYQVLAFPAHLILIHLPTIFPTFEDNNFDILSLEEMVVLQSILNYKNIPIPNAFINRIKEPHILDNSIGQYMLGRAYTTGKGVKKKILI